MMQKGISRRVQTSLTNDSANSALSNFAWPHLPLIDFLDSSTSKCLTLRLRHSNLSPQYTPLSHQIFDSTTLQSSGPSTLAFLICLTPCLAWTNLSLWILFRTFLGYTPLNPENPLSWVNSAICFVFVSTPWVLRKSNCITHLLGYTTE